MSRWRRTTLGMAMSVWLVGCASGPTYQPPVPPAIGGFVEGSQDGVSLTPVPDHGWTLFDNPVLHGLIERALAANTDLRVAAANLQMARAALHGADAARLPATVLESHLNADNEGRQPSTSSLPKTSYDVGLTLAYELDLFGRLGSASAAARADAEASAAAMDAVRTMVVADTVSAFVDLCGATVQAALAREQIASQQRSHDLVVEQLREGEVSPLELAQARTQLALTQATLPGLEAAQQQARFRLATLQGRPPAEATQFPITCDALPRLAAPLPVGDGASLLVRRPDIREAERKLAAATARIGVATADLYPRVAFGGSLGWMGGQFDSFLTPLISWSFPNRQAARAKIAIAQGGEQAALAQWDATVLRALQEVETALTHYRAENQRRAILATAYAESEMALKRALARYRHGADSYLAVLDAERTRNGAASERILSNLRIAQLEVGLFRALGGGWQAAPLPSRPTGTNGGS